MLCTVNWKENPHPCTSINLGLYFDMAVMVLDDSLYSCHAQAAPKFFCNECHRSEGPSVDRSTVALRKVNHMLGFYDFRILAEP